MEVQSTNVQSLGSLLKQIENNTLILPSWQRDSVWTKIQKKEWHDTIKNATGGIVSGIITIFRYKDESRDVPRKLNDGGQRIYHNLPSLKADLIAARINPDSILERVMIAVQDVIYNDIAEATNEFFRMNSLGTSATPYELMQTIYAEKLKDYGEDVWKGQLSKIEMSVNNSLCQISVKPSTKRPKQHTRNRDSHAMFLRFITKNNAPQYYRVGNTALSPLAFKNQCKLETQLAELMNSKGANIIDDEIKLFDKFVVRNVAYIESLLKEHLDGNEAPLEVLVRSVLNYLIYFSNMQYTNDSINDFLKELFKQTGNKSQMMCKEKKSGRFTNIVLATQKLSNLNKLQNVLGCQLIEKEKRVKSTIVLKSGYEHSHIKSFANNGNGETVPENAVSNRARGNKDMTEEELQNLI